MREILFKGKRIDNDKWVYGDLSIYNDDNRHLIYDKNFYDYAVYPDTIGQFTGLLDKNNNRIFEGDIVQTNGGLTWLIAFEKNAFVCKDKTMKTYFALWEQWEYNWKSAEDISPSDRFEVVGNIHDNPELLV